MQTKNVFFPILLVTISTMFFFSCVSNLKVDTAYHQDVKSGRKGGETKTEFVITFKKPRKQNIRILEVWLLGHKGYDYYFEGDRTLSDVTLNKTLSTTQKLSMFSLYLSTAKATRKTESKATELSAKISYTDDSSSQQLLVTVFEDRGVKRLRN